MAESPKPITITEPVSVTIDGVAVTAQKGDLLIDACDRAGTHIPRFCYHPRMEPVGMCRMCLVEVDTGRGPALQPSCMLECTDGMTVDTQSDKVVKAQNGVLEFLLINHPLDCPVCDKGGECPLQDNTMAYGPGESRWVEEKRHYEKPIPISDTVQLDRERCILCDRCTRFADDVAGDALIHFMDRGSATQVNTFPEEPFSSYFSGNTVQICPVGALTATPYRFKARPWDLAEVESTCTTCSVGCRTTVHTSRNQVLRYQGVDSDPVNWSWLCDKGRFSFEANQSDDRLAAPLARVDGELRPARWNDAMAAAAAAITTGLDRSGPSGVAVLGGARLTNESAYAWTKFAKGAIGTDHVDAQLGDGLPADLVSGVPAATIDDVCRPGGTVLYLGPDPKEELAVLYLRLRHAVQKDGVTLIEVTPQHTGLSDDATHSVRYAPGHAADTVSALLSGAGADEAATAAVGAADQLTVVVGRPSLGEAASTIVDAVAAIQAARPDTTFLPVLRRGNIRGAIDAGMAPGMLPGRVRRADAADYFASRWPTVPTEDGLDAAGILHAAADGRIDTLILLGCDPISDFPDRQLAERAIAGARNVIAVDTFLNETSARADVVLAAAAYGEVDGTTTNLEGRVTSVARAVTPVGTAREDWMLASELANRLGHTLGLASLDEIWSEIDAVSTIHAGADLAALMAGDNPDGVLLGAAIGVVDGDADTAEDGDVADDADEAVAEATDDASDDAEADADEAVAEEPADTAPALIEFVAPAPSKVPAVDSYAIRLVVGRRMYDDGVGVRHTPSATSSVHGTALRLNPADFDKAGVDDDGRVTMTNGDRRLVVDVLADSRVEKGTGSIAFGQPGCELGHILDNTQVVCDVRLEAAR